MRNPKYTWLKSFGGIKFRDFAFARKLLPLERIVLYGIKKVTQANEKRKTIRSLKNDNYG